MARCGYNNLPGGEVSAVSVKRAAARAARCARNAQSACARPPPLQLATNDDWTNLFVGCMVKVRGHVGPFPAQTNIGHL